MLFNKLFIYSPSLLAPNEIESVNLLIFFEIGSNYSGLYPKISYWLFKLIKFYSFFSKNYNCSDDKLFSKLIGVL